MAVWIALRAVTSQLAPFRYAFALVALAALLAVAVQPVISGSYAPLPSKLDPSDRTELYKQLTTMTTTLLGFLVTAIAILVALDVRRKIVEELQRGESFSLLVVNLLVAVGFLFVASVLGITCVILDDAKSSRVILELFYDWVILSSLFQLALGLFFFGVVMYKVAAYE